MATNAVTVAGFMIFAVLLQCVSAQNSTLVDNTTACDPFATRTNVNSTYDECRCQDDFQGNGTYCAVVAQLNCSSSVESDGFAYKVYLNQTYIDYYYDYRNLRLLNESCNDVTIEDGYYVVTSPSYEQCGSNVTNTSNTIIYSNAVLSNGGGISSGDILQIPFQCIVTAELTIGMNDDNDTALPIGLGQVLGNSRIEFPVQQGTGVVTATMYLYQDANYATVFNGVPVLTTADMLYIKIALDTVLNGVYIIAKQCWATPDEDGILSPQRFDIIEPPGCLKNSVTKGALTSNGISEESRFQLQVFQFLPFPVVYLHCQVQLCTPTATGSCQPLCNGNRRRRKRDLGETKLMTSQLIIRSEDGRELVTPPNTPVGNTTNEDTSNSDTFEVTILLPVLLGLVLVLILAIIGLFVWIYMRNRRGK